MDLDKLIREEIVAHMINGKSFKEAVYSAFDRAKQVYLSHLSHFINHENEYNKYKDLMQG